MDNPESARPLYIFDIDGTIANIDHRKHLLLETNNPNRWEKFYRLCPHDTPNQPVVDTLRMLWLTGAEIWFFSGRSDMVHEETVQWLVKHTFFRTGDPSMLLFMRQEGDHSPDFQLKQLWLNKMTPKDRRRLVAVFEDRTQVVKMWRRNGVPCFQVADGEF